MLLNNGRIFDRRPYPSPNPRVRLTEITYWSEGLRVKGLLAQPIADGEFEGLLYLRGGIQNIGMVRPARIAQFAEQGCVVFAPYYRGNRGGEGKDEFGGADRMDAVNAVDVLWQYCQHRVHLFGFSRGGLMTLWTVILRDDISSAVIWAGVSDVKDAYEERLDMRRMMKRLYGGTPGKVPEVYKERTPLYSLEHIQAPLLIIHGTKDWNVPISHAKKLEEGLMALGKSVDTWYYEGMFHAFAPSINREIVRKLCKWIKER